ncbi:adenylate kinase family protein [Alphaproteobacteria bacterium endosymbiont of Tiliacea citrago]|uniref:adenylate kinase family protein n=1 Tax=Alphaproteobacteria bacterium endosymbiont of Tiliacea citrago TaxID=3077944 RepID=UPI00313C500D
MILFIGPPGCGKGTQSNLFQEIYKISNFSFGSFLRELTKKNDELGLKVSELIDKGNFVSSDLIFNNIDKSIFEKNLILDGYPRTLEQAVFFNDFLVKKKLKIDLIVEFSAKEEDFLLRVLNRKICEDCRKDFCDCGSNRFVIREDDNKTIFYQRLANYNKNRILIKNFYIKNKVNYVSFNASQTKEESFKNLEKILKENKLI